MTSATPAGDDETPKEPVQVTADDLADEEFGPVKEKGKKGKKGKSAAETAEQEGKYSTLLWRTYAYFY